MARDCSPQIIDHVLNAATRVHRVLGPGLLESVYQKALLLELQAAGVPTRAEVEVPVQDRGVHLGCAFRLDLLVADQLVLEVKSVERIDPVHFKQLRSYLRCADVRVGFILNFNRDVLKSGIRRVRLD